MRKVPVNESVGLVLGHDITKIVPGREKYAAFKKGQLITPGDIPILRTIGKEHIYVWEPTTELIHEDEAALRLAQHAAGPGLSWTKPGEGRVNLKAEYDGLLKVQVEQLNWINNLDDIIFSTLHNNRTVVKEQLVAGTRIVPISIKAQYLEEAEKLCCQPLPLISIKPFRPLWVGIVTTGTEVYEGLIRDGFGKVIRQKTAPFGGRLMGQVIVPDDPDIIAQEILNLIAQGAELVLVTGGMSVDPDDVTPAGIRATGADIVFYGSPVLPGSQFMLAYRGHVPICGVPGGALYNRNTMFDLILPRIFAEDRINRSEIVALGHGGFCEQCKVCHFPTCPFGKSPG
ncbi:MAG: molybdopterin-binding protein [Syntrophomonadaceae bacterium]|nr:molybdopterin-binding protein [Syntrophomonadaceae bacterium]